MPIQRLPRYQLLFAEIIKQSQPPKHTDSDDSVIELEEPGGAAALSMLEQALAKIIAVARFVNEAKGRADNQWMKLQVQRRLGNTWDIINCGPPDRVLIREGVLIKAATKTLSASHSRVFVLFDDMLLVRDYFPLLQEEMWRCAHVVVVWCVCD